MITSRRSFLRTLTGLIAAPAIVKVADLMPVKKPLLVERPQIASPIPFAAHPCDLAGPWKQGDVVYNIRPVSGAPFGWVCIGGNTWKSMGALT